MKQPSREIVVVYRRFLFRGVPCAPDCIFKCNMPNIVSECLLT